MTVTDVHRDAATLTMTITTEFDAPIDRVWQLWANPRLLEQWWGPPTWPATFVDHDLSVDGEVTYYMTGPDGERAGGWWTIRAVDPPNSLEFEDGFSNPDGTKNRDMPMTIGRVTITEQDGGTRMVLASQFPSLDAMEQLVAMGMEDGIRAAMGQMDALLT
jgi:uncharacterized protein YndB with AHSA1/START domain